LTKCRYCGKRTYTADRCPHCGEYYCLEHRDPRTHGCPSEKESEETESQPTYAVTGAVKPQKSKEKKGVLTIRFTFLEGKKRSDREQRPNHAKAIEPRSPPTENQKAAKFAVREVRREDPSKSDSAGAFEPLYVPEETARALAFPSVFDNASRKLFAVSFILVVAEEVLRLVSYVENPPFLAYLDGNLFVRILNGSMAPHVASLIVFALMCSMLFVTTRLASMNQYTGNSRFSLLKQAIPFGVYVAVSVTYIVSITNWFFILRS